jgi:hypothetical protein
VPNSDLFNQLYYHEAGAVWELDGGSTLVSKQSISATISMYLANNISPQIYFFKINNAFFEHMKSYFTGLNFTTLGLESMGVTVVANILTAMPASVTTIGIANLGPRALDTFYRRMREFSREHRHIQVICGAGISDQYKAKFLVLNGQITVIPDDDSTQMIIKSVATVVKKEKVISSNRKRKRKIKSEPVEESAADLIIRQMKRIGDLEAALGINSTARTYLSLLEENKILDERATQLTDRNTYLENQLEISNNRLFELERRAKGLKGLTEYAALKQEKMIMGIPVQPPGLLSSSSSLFSVNPPDTSPAISSTCSSFSASSLSNYSLFPAWVDPSSSSSSSNPEAKSEEYYSI